MFGVCQQIQNIHWKIWKLVKLIENATLNSERADTKFEYCMSFVRFGGINSDAVAICLVVVVVPAFTQ